MFPTVGCKKTMHIMKLCQEGFGARSRNIWRIIIVASIATLVQTGSTSKKLVGETATLNCKVGNASKDMNAIDWQHDGKSVFIDGSRIKKITKYVMEIDNIQYADSGVYTCYSKAVLLSTVKLTVEGKPSLVEVFGPQTIFSRHNFSLECAAQSIPIALFKWERNGVQLANETGVLSVTSRTVGTTVRSTVTVIMASYLHNGSYSCVASNIHGSKTHKAPIQIYVGAYIKKPPKFSNFVRRGTDISLTCVGFGNPIPKIIWFPATANISDTTHFKSETSVNGFVIESKLVIRRIREKDGGNFTCFVINSFSNPNKATAMVFVRDVPKCCHFTVQYASSGSVTISWKVMSDGGSPITFYDMSLKRTDSTAVSSSGDVKSSATFEYLEPDTEFEFGVVARNDIGSSNRSFVTFKTQSAEYTKCLTLRTKKITSMAVDLEWSRKCNATASSFYNYLYLIIQKGAVVVNESKYQRDEWHNNFTIGDLKPFTEYGFKVREIASHAKQGFESQLLTVKTKEAAPSIPRDIKATLIGKSSIKVTWNAPVDLNGIIREYEIEYGYNEKDKMVHVANKKSIDAVVFPERQLILKDLMMNTLYNVSVRERTEVGLWSEMTVVPIKTKEGVPAEPPKNVSVILRNNSFITLTWQQIPTSSLNGDLIGYKVVVENITGHVVINETMPPIQTTIKIDTLEPHRQYELKIYGFTRAGPGKARSYIFFTADGVPSVPRDFVASAASSTTMRLQWRQPQNTNGIIISYQINWKKIKDQMDRIRRSALVGDEDSVNKPLKDLNQIREYFIKNLTPYSIYTFRVREKTAKGWGPFTKPIQAATLEGESSPPVNLTVQSKTSKSVTFQWRMPRNPNGAIKIFTVLCYQDKTTLKDNENITIQSSVSLYQATCDGLKRRTETTIMVFAVGSVKGKMSMISTTTAAGKDTFPWLPIIGGCVGFVVVVALILTIVLLCRRKAKYIEVKEAMEDVEMNGVLNSRPIHIANLKQYVVHNHTNSDHGFFTEYEAIRPSVGNLTWEHSQQQCNQHKNRYSNIVAYDHTRVILSPINDDPGRTYINANYIDGYKHPRKFIATQGPLPETVNDFWRMLYEQRSHVIVMLTRIVEDFKVKCEQYWPDHGTVQYGEIVVKLIDITELSDYVVRTFTIKAAYDVEAVGREVKQYHYLGWPDHGVPEYPTSMVTFTKYVMDNVPAKPGPIIVHCSAGVGRTGAFIVIDSMLNQIRDESIVDVYKFVSTMRKQRNFMVQTEAQYVFIYDALLDAVICGNTEATAHDISLKLRYLNQQSPDTCDTYLMQEFKRLEAGLSSQEKELFSIANQPENKEKNRFLNILPYNRNRVKLAFIYGQKGSDYINASFIDGYRQRHAFIATQGPLENTISDLWRMVWEQNCHNIVMLTKLKEKGKERSCQYWPSCGSEVYGKFLVDELRETDDECENVKRRELNLTYSETGRSRRVNHYMYTGWPEYGSPNSGTDIIKLISLVQEMTGARGSGPVLVHCSGGAGRTGTFIAICTCIQKLKSEGSVDIFQTVRQLRTQRPAMVQTIDQYYFCYQALKDFVDTTADVSKNYDLDESMA